MSDKQKKLLDAMRKVYNVFEEELDIDFSNSFRSGTIKENESNELEITFYIPKSLLDEKK